MSGDVQVRFCERLGVRLPRATHLVILAQRNLEEGISLLNHYMGRLDLRLNEEKTRRMRLNIGNSVDFLGFRFHNVRSRQTGTRLILVYPSPRSQERLRVRVRELVHHSGMGWILPAGSCLVDVP
jgi:hypothetical protein